MVSLHLGNNGNCMQAKQRTLQAAEKRATLPCSSLATQQRAAPILTCNVAALRANAVKHIIASSKFCRKSATGGHSKATPGMVLSSIFTPRMKNAYGTGTSIKKSETLYSPHCLVKECSKIVLDCKYSKKKVYTEFFRHVFRLAMHYYNIFLQFAFSCKCGPLTVLTLKNTSRHPMPADMHTSGSQPQPTIKPGCETACLPMRNGLFRMSEQAVSQCAGCQPVGRCNH